MKPLILFFVFFVSIVCLNGQTTFKRNDIYVEVGGMGPIFSTNYERQLTKQPGLGVRLGVGVNPIFETVFITFPVGVNYLFKLKNEKSFIEAGANIILLPQLEDGYLFEDSKIYFVTTFFPSIAYRRHTTKNMIWRISFTPLIAKDTGFSPWGGISIGKRF